MRIVILLIAFLSTTLQADAQLLKRIIDRTADKIEDAAADKAAELIADQVTRAMNRKIDEVYGDWVREAAKQDSADRVARGDTVDWERAGNNMAKFLKGMNSEAKLRDVYSFDFYMQMEMKSKKLDRTSNYYFNTESPMILVEDQAEEGKRYIIVDMENDATLMLGEDDKGNKHGQALPNMAGIIKATKNDDYEITSFKKGKDTKTIAGYKCLAYHGESKEYDYTYYIANDLPVPDMQKMRSYVAKFNPYVDNEAFSEITGWPMQTIMNGKKKKNEDMTITVLEVGKKSLSINKSDYSFDGNMGQY